MTASDVRDIASESGLDHAEFCIGQEESQIGKEAAAPLWEELAKLQKESA